MQDAFVALARQTTVPDQAAAWLHRVVRNAAVSALRGRKQRNQREARVSTHEAWFSSVDDQLDARNVTLFLAELDLETREVIVARLWGGLNFDQIARLQGSSVAGLRVMEAIRLYMASHGGRLPDSLGSITEVPTPDDPATGKPFEYTIDGTDAVLAVPASDIKMPVNSYRLTPRNKAKSTSP